MLANEIKDLQHELLEMAGLSEQMLRQAIESVLNARRSISPHCNCY